MPSKASLMLRSALKTRLEARSAPMQPTFLNYSPEFGKALQRARPAAPVVIAGCDILKDCLMQGQLRLVAAFGEGHRHQGLVTGFTLRILPGESEDETLRLDDLETKPCGRHQRATRPGSVQA